MKRERHCFQYGIHEIHYEIVRRPRKTLEIAVEPDLSVVVVAPVDAPLETIEARLRKRAAWIVRQRRYFAQFQTRTPERQYISGETHLYLGRQYRLKVVPGEQEMVELVRGFIFVHITLRSKTQGKVRKLLEDWYRARAHIKFPERIETCLKLFPSPEEFRPKGLIIRQLRQRWGSMSPSGRLILNVRLMQAPIDSIDYVITHELCHIAEPHHGPAFLDLLETVMPDWEKRKLRLERTMA